MDCSRRSIRGRYASGSAGGSNVMPFCDRSASRRRAGTLHVLLGIRFPALCAGGVLVLALLSAGCGKDLVPPDTSGSVALDPTVIPQVRATVGDRSVSLTWTVGDTTKVSNYRVYRSRTAT